MRTSCQISMKIAERIFMIRYILPSSVLSSAVCNSPILGRLGDNVSPNLSTNEHITAKSG